ncbi:tripartite tricarboxylate transporter substrate binding protein [Bordetella bronchiseptica]|uniref:tripartite tricarboxylate transporter substrate binding protein n=1 Tax=Bordetella bronchiseptica TaxID=518 RepID=UPI003F742453
MMMTMTKRWLGAGVAAAAMMAGAAAHAADYPQRPITLVVPYAAGGTTDILGRALAEALAGELKQAVVVENKPGANGTRGASGMKQARPDGYTLTMVPLGVFRQPYIQQVNYDPLKDLTYVSMVGGYNYAIAVADKAPWKTIQELIEHARSHPGEIFYGVSARYSVNEFLMMDLGRKAGVEWTSVPFKGDSEAVTNLLGGQIQVVSATNTILPFAQQGSVRVLATAGEARSPDFPDAPTLAEADYPVTVTSPLGIAGPAGMAPETVRILDEAIGRAARNPKLLETAARYGIGVKYLDHAGYTAYARKAAVEEKDAVALMLQGAAKP